MLSLVACNLQVDLREWVLYWQVQQKRGQRLGLTMLELLISDSIFLPQSFPNLLWSWWRLEDTHMCEDLSNYRQSISGPSLVIWDWADIQQKFPVPSGGKYIYHWKVVDLQNYLDNGWMEKPILCKTLVLSGQGVCYQISGPQKMVYFEKPLFCLE